ncbi:MAG: exo-alpha-sialidase [Candidatus Omnitrophica bacterium]|nr:exo-alpha-sialidase [Candidatus Omnitrophota bacterium]
MAAAQPLFAEPFYTGQLIAPLNDLHNHGSSVIELPNGDVLVSWYKGSGERSADDVKIVGARMRQGMEEWSEVFDMADFEDFPDCNVCMTLDREGKLWIFWPLVLAKRWETSILMSRYSTDYLGPDCPKWDWQKPIILKPGEKFAEDSLKAIESFEKELPEAGVGRLAEVIESLKEKVKDPYARQTGWMPRANPTVLPNGRILLPLYSDGFSFSLVAYSDDNGATWQASRPILSMGGVQPSIVWKEDGTLAAFMRDNGPPPKRVIYSESKDGGETWSRGVDLDLPDTGAGVQALRLENGHWLLLNNDVEEGRHSLGLHLSDDEGKTWKWTRHLELVEPGEGSFSYPSMYQSQFGDIHCTYSYKKKADGEGETIKYCRFNEAWVMEED